LSDNNCSNCESTALIPSRTWSNDEQHVVPLLNVIDGSPHGTVRLAEEIGI
ncbi:hypothetical protein SERLADRAFT_462799, partial [Serpula lacrymans var. lacrymans S7.9]